MMIKIAIVTSNNLSDFYLGLNTNTDLPIFTVTPVTRNKRRVKHLTSIIENTIMPAMIEQDSYFTDKLWTEINVHTVELNKVSLTNTGDLSVKKKHLNMLENKYTKLVLKSTVSNLSEKERQELKEFRTTVNVLKCDIEILENADVIIFESEIEQTNKYGVSLANLKIDEWYHKHIKGTNKPVTLKYNSKYIDMVKNGKGVQVCENPIDFTSSLINWFMQDDIVGTVEKHKVK